MLTTVAGPLRSVAVAVKVTLLKHKPAPASTVILVGQVMVGGVVSTTVTVWLHCEKLPQLLMACHVRVAMKVLPQVALVIVLTMINVEGCEAAGSSKAQALPSSTVLFVTQRIAGALVSTTVTVWLQVLLLPQASVARQVRVATNPAPQRLLVTVTTTLIALVPQPSLAVGVSKLQAEPATTVLSATHWMKGGSWSITVMVWVLSEKSPQAVVSR